VDFNKHCIKKGEDNGGGRTEDDDSVIPLEREPLRLYCNDPKKETRIRNMDWLEAGMDQITWLVRCWLSW
jgi:hypothetical protein